MAKRLSVAISALAVLLLAAGAASAQTATQEATAKTKSAAHKTANVLSDAEITTVVKTKLLADKTVGGLKIDVDTNHHVVTLTGPVGSSKEKAQALKLARHTSGVTRVVSRLTIEKDTGTKGTSGRVVDKTERGATKVGEETKDVAKKTGRVLTDAEITTAVKTKMFADKTVSGMSVHVDTSHGVVTLTGDVKSDVEKQQALKIARDTKGVKRVVDNLSVK